MDELIVALSESEFPFLPVTLFPLERVRDAMRFMAQARHVGKIVLTTKAGRADTAPGLIRDGTYWITGGLGALGKETARWLARRGARHLVLSSRHADEAASCGFRSRAFASGRHLPHSAGGRRGPTPDERDFRRDSSLDAAVARCDSCRRGASETPP